MKLSVWPLHRFAWLAWAIICCGCLGDTTPRDTTPRPAAPHADEAPAHSVAVDADSPDSDQPQIEASADAAEVNAAIEKCRTDKATSLLIRSRVDAAALQEIASLDWLRVLELYDVSASPTQLAAATRQMSGLERLRVVGTPLGDAQIFAVCRQHPGLQVLNLPNATFTDAALDALAELPELTLLRFGSPNVTDKGFARLSGQSGLRFLHLINVPISDEGLRHLHDMTQLESLYIDGGNATDQGILALLKANPGIHFHRDQLHVENDPNADDH